MCSYMQHMPEIKDLVGKENSATAHKDWHLSAHALCYFTLGRIIWYNYFLFQLQEYHTANTKEV